MLLAAASVLYIVLTFPSPPPSTPTAPAAPTPTYRLFLLTTLFTTLSLVIYAHITSGDSIFHQIAFVVMIWMVGYRTLVLINRTVPDIATRRKMRKIAAGGAGKTPLSFICTRYG